MVSVAPSGACESPILNPIVCGEGGIGTVAVRGWACPVARPQATVKVARNRLVALCNVLKAIEDKTRVSL